MGVVIEVMGEDGAVLNSATSPTRQVVLVNTTPVVVGDTTPEQIVVEVLQGRPGVQNLFVGATPPSSPEEGWVWIDTSG